MKFLSIILLVAFAAVLLPLLTAVTKNWGRTLAANSREQAGHSNRFLSLAANCTALNDNSHVFPTFSADGPCGVIMAANDANFDATYLSEPLTEFLVDFPDADGLDTLLDRMFPSVPVGRAFTYLKHDSVEAFQAALNNEDIRQIGGEFAQIKLTGTQTNGRTENKGLTILIDNDQGGEDPAVQQRAVANIWNRLLRAEIMRGEALLEANDTATTPNWGGTNTAADPDGNLLEDLDLGGNARGINSNAVLYGGSAWVTRFLSLGLGSNPARHATRNMTPQQLAQLIGAQQIEVSNFRDQASASTKSKLVGNKVFSYYVKAGAMKDDPSNIKRFVTPVPGGGFKRVYIQPLLKRTAVTVEHYSTIDLTSSLGIRKIAPTFT